MKQPIQSGGGAMSSLMGTSINIALTDGHSDREGALLDLEADICDLSSMANVADDLLDRFISSRHDRKRNIISINSYELDMLIFAWKNTSMRASELKRRFYADAYGEDAP